MARKPKPTVERYGGGYRINLQFEERDLIARLMGEMRSLLLGSTDDDRVRRLFPTAYHQEGDRAMDDEYQRLMREDLVTSRLKGLDLVEGCLGTVGAASAQLSDAQMLAFVQALNGVRLVLGTVLDVDEDHDLDDITDDHPLVGEYHLYAFLSWVLDWCMQALQAQAGQGRSGQALA
ncbi:unannotated protein [freshwater metagenome]|uniref:Unannotated protein n=1 Tax=freshwater metagenome TaxID=449393 RepID=A0A6J7DFZ5_9ZZZZ|nr:DUF2017 family protein [Actinomycetota bacterium]